MRHITTLIATRLLACGAPGTRVGDRVRDRIWGRVQEVTNGSR